MIRITVTGCCCLAALLFSDRAHRVSGFHGTGRLISTSIIKNGVSSTTISLPSFAGRNSHQKLPSLRNDPRDQLRMQPLTGALLEGIRGGGFNNNGGAILSSISQSLESGPLGILSLWGIASSVLIPLTMYRQGWSFSVGYGYSVMTMGIFLLNVMKPAMYSTPWFLVTSTVFYGFRLGTFLLIRQAVSKKKGDQMKGTDKSPRLQRIPFATSVALFYAMMTSPNLYVLRNNLESGSIMAMISTAGAALAWVGAILEAIADAQKLIVKQQNLLDVEADKFVGPTGGVYQISRHPNYLGELCFWFGLLLSGAPTFGRSIQGWIASLLGYFGIYNIMTGATKRLVSRQEESYKGQPKYDEWKEQVKAPLFPFVQ